jgi:AcrR family transcriptional regulator
LTNHKQKQAVGSDTARESPRRPRRQAERREDAMTRILDAAEKLYALHGRDAVTVKAIASAAGVDYQLVSYYFGDAEAVFKAVFQRKSLVINEIRNRRMDEYWAHNKGRLTVEGVFEAFLRPSIQTVADDPDYWTNYAAIVSYTNSSHFGGRELMRDAFDVTVHHFIDMLKELAPEVPSREIYWLYHHVSASLTLALAQTGRIDVLSKGECRSADLMTALDSMIRVFSAGFEGLRAKAGATSAAKGTVKTGVQARKGLRGSMPAR